MRRHSPLPILGGLLALYVAVPVVAFAIRLISTSDRGFHTPGLGDALYVSAATATMSTVVIALFGLPLAYLLARSKGRIASIVGVIVYLPLALPPVMSGILLIYLIGPYTPVGKFFGGHLTESFTGIVLAQTFVAAPFLVVAARSAMHAIDSSLFEKAATLGRGPLERFWKVAVPVAWSGIRAGLLLSWLRAFGEYGATVIVGYHPYSLPVFTYLQFSGPGLPATIAPTALALGLAVIVVCLSRVRPRVRRTKRDPLISIVAHSPQPQEPVRVSFDLDQHIGEFHLKAAYRATTPRIAILGASGAGKSCILRSIAGLLGTTSVVKFNEQDVSKITTELRNVGYVPQSLALFPHLSISQQLVFGRDSDPALARYWLDRLHIGELVGRLPNEISGGQRQRVCLAQALSRTPELVLLDEPFSALDAPVRSELRHEFRRLQRENGLSTVLVTHDPEEAAMLADEVIVIANGEVLQAGPREEVFREPVSPQVARLLGVTNIFRGRVTRRGIVRSHGLDLLANTADFEEGTDVLWCVHPESMRIGDGIGYQARVSDLIDLGGSNELVLSMGDDLEMRLRSIDRDGISAGQELRVEFPPDAVKVWKNLGATTAPSLSL